MSSNTSHGENPIPMKKFNLKVTGIQSQNRSIDPSYMGKTRTKSTTSTSSSSNKMVGMGIARRPSDNLLLKFNTSNQQNDKNTTTSSMIISLPPPKKHFSIKNERPISNDSISTKTSDLFSSPSSDLNSGSSSIVNDSDIEDSEDHKDATSHSIMEESIISEGNSTLILNTTESNQELTPSHKQQPVTENPNNDQNQKYLYSNSSVNNKNFQNINASTPNFKHNPSASTGASNQAFHKPSLYGHSNSTTAILPKKMPLTASQRYRLRKEQNETSLRNSIKKKEKFYDEQNGMLELQDGYIDDSLIWNIPMASFSTSSFLTSGTKHQKQKHRTIANKRPISLNNTFVPLTSNSNLQHNPSRSVPANGTEEGHSHKISSTSTQSAPILDFNEMPTSPIPGISRVSDFQYIHETTKNLSNVYLHSQNILSKSRLSERTASADFLPLDFKVASDNGMEDLLLVSQNKLDAVSNSRPSWLPPKDPEEKKMHDYQISKSISMASIEQLDKSKGREERLIKDETNRAKLVLLLDRDITRNSSLSSLKKIVWETSFCEESRRQIYDEILQSRERLITEKYMESFDDLRKLLDSMDFPRGKEIEIEQLINNGIRDKRGGRDDQPVISNHLMLMLKIKSISSQGLSPGDELLFHHFLVDGSFKTLKDVWEMANLIQMTCFNDACKNKYDTNILNHSIVTKYLLKTNSFKDEFNTTCLNSSTWWNILERVDHNLFMWIMDTVVVNNCQPFKNYPVNRDEFKDKDWEYYRSKRVVINYKILLSFALNVLLNYHFGFNDLKSLANLNEKDFSIPIPMDELLDAIEVNGMFIRKWLHYNKKF